MGLLHPLGQKRPLQHHQGIPPQLGHGPVDRKVAHVQVLGVVPQGLGGVGLKGLFVVVSIELCLSTTPFLPLDVSLVVQHPLDVVHRLPGHPGEPGHLGGGVARAEENGDADPFVPLRGHFLSYFAE